MDERRKVSVGKDVEQREPLLLVAMETTERTIEASESLKNATSM